MRPARVPNRFAWYCVGIMIKLRAIACVAGVALVGSAMAADTFLGPEFGYYFPSNSELRRALGDQWFSVGLSTSRGGELTPQQLGTSFNVITRERGGNKVFIGSYTIGSAQLLGDQRSNRLGKGLQPYVAARAGVAYFDYGIGAGSFRESGKRIGWNANAEVGFVLDGRLTLSARYDVFSRQSGFQFDGFSVSLKYGLFRF